MAIYFSLMGFHNPFYHLNNSMYPLPLTDLASPVKQKPMLKKSVSFSNVCQAFLIPTREEYLKANVDLWWTRNDYAKFRVDSLVNWAEEVHPPKCVSGRDSIENMQKLKELSELRILVVSNERELTSKLMRNFAKYVDEMSNLEHLYIKHTVNFVSHQNAMKALHSHNFYHNIVLVDCRGMSSNESATLFSALQMFKSNFLLVCIHSQHTPSDVVGADLVIPCADTLSFRNWCNIVDAIASRK